MDTAALTKPYDDLGLATYVFRPADGSIEFSEAARTRFGLDWSYGDVLDSYDNFILPTDRAGYERALESLAAGSDLETVTMRTASMDACCRITLRAVERDAGGVPTTILGLIEDTGDQLRSELLTARVDELMREGEVDEELAAARDRVSRGIGGMFLGVYHVWVADETYVCFREGAPGVLSAIGKRGSFPKAWEAYLRDYVDPEFRAELVEFTDLGKVCARLMRADAFSFEYLRVGLGWSRGTFAVAGRDEAGAPEYLLFTVADINSERESAKREQEALFEASHDALTGVLNRGAFDRAVETGYMGGRQSGFILVDIDNFKQLNDDHGHDFGDKAIRAVAHELATVFREGDDVFRIGGDEFAVLLNDCAPSSWNAVCSKIRRVHADLREALPASGGATISAGACFGENGLESWMYEAADKGLYNTKRNGRAGCTLVDGEGVVTNYWKDRTVPDMMGAAIEGGNIGVSRIEVAQDGSRPPILVAGATLRHAYAIPIDVSVEDCYGLWRRGIDGDYRKVLEDAMTRMAEGVNVECTLLWHHPDGHDFLVRLTGTGKVEDGVATLYVIHHSLEGTEVVARGTTDDPAIAESGFMGLPSRLASSIEDLIENPEDILCVASFNLTTDEMHDMRSIAGLEGFSKVASYTEVSDLMSDCVVDSATAVRFRRGFSRKSLIERARQGERHFSLDGLIQLGEGHTQWVQSAVELIPNPVTGDVEGISYARDITRSRIEDLLVGEVLQNDFPAAAVLLNGGEEFYLFDRSWDEVCVHHRDFWGSFEGLAAHSCGQESAHEQALQLDRDAIMAALREGSRFQYAFATEVDGEPVRYAMRFSMLDREHGLILCGIRDITDRDLFEQLRQQTMLDPVTGLYNRRAAFAEAERVLAENPEVDFSFVRLDVKRFRIYNSFYGEQAGDELLRAIAGGMRTLEERYGTVAYGRLEADVFCALIPTDADVFERGVAALLQEFAALSPDFPIEPSVGVYPVTDRTMPIESMLACAETAAKANAREVGRVVGYYDDETGRRLAEDLLINRDMQDALDRGEFVVYIQPKFDLRTGEVAGGETLCRWMHPEHGVILPERFIPLFEENGFIAKLDRYMWEQTCELLQRWMNEGLRMRPVSVNMSRASAYNPGTAAFLEELVDRYDIIPQLLELELTETAYINDPDAIRDQLEELQAHGFKILMDDFGSGYSSIATLQHLPIDILKLDMDLVSHHAGKRGKTILEAMVDMTQKLGLPIVAEGVETREQADYLRSLGCEYAQGFLYSEPVPVSEYESMMR